MTTKEISVTVTCGVGSEVHNHDLEYRVTLKHVHECEDGVVELVDYVPYRDQINELMRPYIEEYNLKVEQRYKDAWNRYDNGLIKTKPRKRDYKIMSYDYYTDHLNDQIKNPVTGKMENMQMFRSMIIGLGDKKDRDEKKITKDQALFVFDWIHKEFMKMFPFLHILGASVHFDENGFYHMHLDYKPIMRISTKSGLQCSVSQDRVLQEMGFEPEQALINDRDKVPIRFNTLRNKVYYMAEKGLNQCGIGLLYGATALKDPEKDSSKNNPLNNWQNHKDTANILQHNKNIMLATISDDEVSPDGFKDFLESFTKIELISKEIENSPCSRLDKNKRVVSFHLFDQLRSFLKMLLETIRHLFHKIDICIENLHYTESELEKYKDLAEENIGFKEKYFSTISERTALKNENIKLQKELKAKDLFLEKFRSNGKTLKDVYYEQNLKNDKEIFKGF